MEGYDTEIQRLQYLRHEILISLNAQHKLLFNQEEKYFDTLLTVPEDDPDNVLSEICDNMDRLRAKITQLEAREEELLKEMERHLN